MTEITNAREVDYSPKHLINPFMPNTISQCYELDQSISFLGCILMGKRELVALLSLTSWCLVIVVWLFLAVPWVCLQFVIVVFPRLLFLVTVNSEIFSDNFIFANSVKRHVCDVKIRD